jgi:spermidine synthase
VDETEGAFENLNAEIVEKYVLDGSHHGIVEHELEKASDHQSRIGEFKLLREPMDFMDLSKIAGYRPSRQQLAVVVSGIVSMGLEILAGRVLAPEFGSTIYTWGSIIGISMLALSLGYHRGGKSAEKADEGYLDRFLIFTAAYIVFLTVFGEQVLTISSLLPIGTRYAALVPVATLFGPPTYFLGFISPYAVQLSKKESKGEASGHFYAVGTAGSILGAFGTTFFLIPNFSVNVIYAIFTGLALIPVVRGLNDPRTYLLPILVVSGLFLSGTASIPGNTIYQDSTPYQELRVADENSVRTLYLDGQPQSAMYLEERTGYPWDYPRYFHIPFLMRDDVEKVLFIGGGGFSGPKRFAEMNITVHAVELDPGVIKAARRYFNVSESEHLKIYNMDGREFLQESNHTYDVVYLDAYRKSKVPFHLTTKEFMELAYEKTDENGIIFSNTISTASGPGSEFSKAQYKTISQVFPAMYYFPTSNTRLAQNIEIIGSKNQQLTEEQLLEMNKGFEDMNLSREINRLERPDAEDATVLTDDYAPVDTLLEPLIGRRYVVH